MKRHLSIFAFLFLLSHPLRAQYDYKIISDKNLSSKIGAADLVTLQKFIFTGEDLLLKPTLFSEDNILGKSGGIAYRLAKTIFLDGPVDILIGVTNHEYFGHGWRLREYQRSDIHYTINLPPPYGNGGGMTSLGIGEYYSDDKDAVMRIAGVQANSTVAEELRNVFLETGKIQFRQSFAYIGGISDQTQYILLTKSSEYTSNDISYYTELVSKRNPAITLSLLKKNVLLNFANPFFLYSIYSFFDRYLVYGESEITYPMIHVLDLDYLPSFRFGLTPFGAEIRWENLVKYNTRIYNFYLGYDGFGQFTSSRFGIQIDHIYKNELIDIGGKFELWRQPYFDLNSNSLFLADVITVPDPAGSTGGMFLANAKIHPFSPGWGVYLETGYKSIGFVESEQLGSGLIFRGGFTIRM